MSESARFDLSQNPTIDATGNLGFVPRVKAEETTKEKVKRLVEGLEGVKKEAGDLHAKKIESYANAVAQEVVDCFEKFGPDLLEDTFLQRAQMSHTALEVEYQLINEILRRDDPKDLKILAQFLAKLSPEVIANDDGLSAAVQKLLEKFDSSLKSESLDEATCKECIKLFLKNNLDVDRIRFWLTKIEITDKAFDWVIQSCKEASDPSAALTNFVQGSLNLAEKMKEGLPQESSKEIYRLAIFRDSPWFDAESLNLMANSLIALESDLGTKDFWEEARTKFVSSLTVILSSTDEDTIKSLLAGALLYSRDSSWFQAVVLNDRLTPEVAELLFNALKALSVSHSDLFEHQGKLLEVINTASSLQENDKNKDIVKNLRVAYLTKTDSFTFTHTQIEDLIAWLASPPEVDAETLKELLNKFSLGVQEYIQAQGSVKAALQEINALIKFAMTLEPSFKEEIASQLDDIVIRLVEKNIDAILEHAQSQDPLTALKEISEFIELISAFGGYPARSALTTRFENAFGALLEKNIDAFLQNADHFQILNKLFSLQLSEAHIDTVRKAYERAKGDLTQEPFVTLTRVFQRFDQLKKLLQKSPQEALQHAYFIERKIPQIRKTAEAILISRAESGLSSAVVFDPEKGVAAITGEHFPEGTAGGTKKPIHEIVVLFNDFSKHSAGVRAYSRRRLGGLGIAAMAKDKEFLGKFKGVPHVVQMNYYVEHLVTPVGQAEPFMRASIGMEKLVDADSIVQNPGLYTSQKKAKLFKDFIEGAHEVLSRKVLHRDLKPANFFIDENGVGKVGDFGWATEFSSDQPVKPGQHFSKRYPSYEYGAPELLWNENYNGDPLLVEAFAMGVSLFQMINGKFPPHVELMRKQFEELEGKEVKPEELAAMRKQVSAEVDKMFKSPEYLELLEKERTKTLNQEDKLKLLAYSMMRTKVDDTGEGEKRCSIAQAKDRIAEIVREG